MKKAILAPNCTQAVFTKYMYDQQSSRFSENSEVTGDKDSADSDSKTCTSGSTSSLAHNIRCYISIVNISWSMIGHWSISYLSSDQCSDSVWGVAVRCGLLCIPTGVTWRCVVQGSQVNLVHLICVRTTCIGLVSANPCRGCCVCRGSFNLCMNCSTLHVSTQWLCQKPSSLENPLGCCWRINIDWLIDGCTLYSLYDRPPCVYKVGFYV